ncbi:MAG TPA: ABC-2 family transporter protein [Spirochaetia bacterium]|nr:ABC-2 family transporter protein [Spirochaetia bacterium]
MTGIQDVYRQQFKTTLASFIQYRASIFIWTIDRILEPLIYLVVWSAVARATGGRVGGFDASQFAGYFIVMMLVTQVTYTWVMYEYEYKIRHGSLSFALLRPIHPIHTDLVDNISSKLITLPLMLVAAFVLVVLFKPAFSPPVWAAALFVPALLLAFAVKFVVEWTLALSAFWTTRVSAVNQGYFVAALFLSGQMAPLSLLPHSLQVAASLLPFRWMISFPVELILGRLSPAQAAAGLAAQGAWLCLGLVMLRAVWRAGVRVYSAVGA